MIDFIDTEPDVLAVTIAGKIREAELESILDRLEPMLNAHETVHVFVETRGIDGIELSGLGRYAGRALPLLGKLRSFGRVAVVADQGWVRAATKIESALLPFISYNTFPPEDRDLALDWVRGKRPAAV